MTQEILAKKGMGSRRKTKIHEAQSANACGDSRLHDEVTGDK